MNSKNLKFLLVHPEISRTKYNFKGVIDNEPLELEYISSMLKEHGFEVEIWDGQVEENSLTDKLKAFNPNYVYVCGRTRQENFMKEYCKNAKDLCNSITIIGGIYAQHNYERFYDDFVDYILICFDIFKIIDVINMKPLPEIDGICYKENNKWVENKPRPFDVNKLPCADRSYFYKHLDKYRYLELLPCAHVRTSYSCPFKCKFCYRNRLNCGVYTARDIEDAVNEIRDIDCENIYIIDDDFLVDCKRIEEFIRLIKVNDIHKRFVCYGRADFISKNPELMRELKEIGFYYILVGLETVSEKYLASYNKKSGLECNIKTVEILNNVDINIMGMFIVDLDYTAKDFRILYKWIKKHKLRHTAISIFTPELSSEVYDEYRERIITDNPEHWDYLHVVAQPENLSLKGYYFHYHILLAKLLIRGWRDGIYDFLDYGYYIKTILKNLFKFGG
ncbi:MAG TPA: radical SAM protein [Clostridiales bacterium]|nr:radical SAM protein [Clostridiales bacterium]